MTAVVDNSELLGLADDYAEYAEDQTVASKGGGTFEVAPAGHCRLRLVSYIELGKHSKKNHTTGKDQTQDMVSIGFELSGPKHKPRETDNGTVPFRITLTMNKSQNEKARFFKLFKVLNYDGQAKHMSQLLGKDFKAQVIHKISGAGETAKTYANLEDDNGWTISAPYNVTIDEETGEEVRNRMNVAPAISAMRLFIWNAKSELLKKMWASIFIDGEYEGESKNRIQEKIKRALNYEGSPIQLVLDGADTVVESVVAAKKVTKVGTSKKAKAEAEQAGDTPPVGAEADPLAGIGQE